MIGPPTVNTGWWGIVLDAPDAAALGRFYAAVLGWPIEREEPGGVWLLQPGTTAYLAIQESTDYVPPVWPAREGDQQMMLHLDIGVANVETAVEAAVAHGATLAEYQPQESVRVLFDPAGHPFCLYLDPPEDEPA